MQIFFKAVDRFSIFLSRISDVVTIALVVSMIYEVVARYLFSAPTIWAFDISYMATGTLFILGAANALREDAHVRIDFLAEKMPSVIRRGIEAIAFCLILLPIFAFLTSFAIRRAWRAFETAEVEMVSPWAPLMWPFYTLLAIGLLALTLQITVHGLRAAFDQKRPDNSFELEA